MLRPLLVRLTSQLARQQTLEGVKDVFEEIEAVLSGWSSWPYAVSNALTLDLRDVTGPQQHSDVETFQWTGNARQPQRREMIPHFEDLKKLARLHDRLAPIALRVESRGDRVGKGMLTLASWDEKDRALVQWVEKPPGRKFGIEQFAVWPMGQYLEALEESERSAGRPGSTRK